MVVQRAEQFGRGEEGKGRRQCRQVGPGHRWERERVLAGFAGLGVRRGGAGMAETDWAGASGQARKRSGAHWLGLGRAGWPRASERVGPRETMGRVEVWADILG